jgi:hypothetical protein
MGEMTKWQKDCWNYYCDKVAADMGDQVAGVKPQRLRFPPGLTPEETVARARLGLSRLRVIIDESVPPEEVHQLGNEVRISNDGLEALALDLPPCYFVMWVVD